MLDLLLFQRQRVLHGVGLAFRLQHTDGGLSLGLFHLLHFGGIGVGFSDLHLLLVDFGLHAHSVVLLFLQQQRFEALGILLRQFDVAQHDFFDHDAVGAQPFANHLGGALPNFFAFGGEHFAHRIARHQFTPRGGDDRRDDFPFQRLRQVGLNVVEALGVDLVADGDGEAERETLLGLYAQRVAFRRALGRRIFADAGGEQLVARVEKFDALDQRHHEVHARIQRPRQRAFSLAHAHASHSARHDDDSRRDQQRHPRQHHERNRCTPAHRWSKSGRACLRVRVQTPALPGNQQVRVIGENSGGDREHRDPHAQQQMLQQQHGNAPFNSSGLACELPGGARTPPVQSVQI